MDGKTYGQGLANTFPPCTWANGLREVTRQTDTFLAPTLCGQTLLPVAALPRQGAADLTPVNIQPLKASGEGPDVTELGTLAKPSQHYFENVVLAFLPHPFLRHVYFLGSGENVTPQCPCAFYHTHRSAS